MSKLNAYSLRRKRDEPKVEDLTLNLDDLKLSEELKKIAVPQKIAEMWAADPCARPC